LQAARALRAAPAVGRTRHAFLQHTHTRTRCLSTRCCATRALRRFFICFKFHRAACLRCGACQPFLLYPHPLPRPLGIKCYWRVDAFICYSDVRDGHGWLSMGWWTNTRLSRGPPRPLFREERRWRAVSACAGAPVDMTACLAPPLPSLPAGRT